MGAGQVQSNTVLGSVQVLRKHVFQHNLTLHPSYCQHRTRRPKKKHTDVIHERSPIVCKFLQFLCERALGGSLSYWIVWISLRSIWFPVARSPSSISQLIPTLELS